MAADNPRLDDLRRRVQQDPASIAFAQLAEEYRRSGDHQEAVRVCRAGLAHHPSYLSARVTLGRALMTLGQRPEAEAEFELVLQAAPDNLVALKSLEELRQGRQGDVPAAHAGADLKVRPYTEDGVAAGKDTDNTRRDASLDASPPKAVSASPPKAVADPVRKELEGWLAAIRADRIARKGATPQ